MGFQVVNGAQMTCSFGAAPAGLIVLPANRENAANQPAANIMDYKPIVNIPPFGMCNSVANPATKRPPPVIFTPAPCTPVTSAPWVPGVPTKVIAKMPALNDASKCMCNWAGVITIVFAGQTKVMVG